jgi:hypothetical protein
MDSVKGIFPLGNIEKVGESVSHRAGGGNG